MATTAQGLVPRTSTDRRTMSRALLAAVIALAVLTLVAVAWPMRANPDLAPSQPGAATARQQTPGRAVPFGATNPSITGRARSGAIARQQTPGRAVPFGATNPSISGSGTTHAFGTLARYPQTR